MTDSPKDAASPPKPPTTAVKLGKLTLTGPAAVLAGLIIPGAVLALVIWSKPSLGMLLSGGMWLGFIIFWNVTAHRGGAAAGTQESTRSRAAHQNLLGLGFLLLFVPVPGLRWSFLPASAWLVPAGLGVQVAAAVLHIWARRHLGRNWSSEVMIQTEHRLVRSGPYRLLRHPIYTAILGLAIGTAVVSAELHSALGVVTIAFSYLRKIRLEERLLAETFGAEWDSYRKTSWALVPWLF